LDELVVCLSRILTLLLDKLQVFFILFIFYLFYQHSVNLNGGSCSATASAGVAAVVSGERGRAVYLENVSGRGRRVDEGGVSVPAAHGEAAVRQDGGVVDEEAQLCARDNGAG
jgi:hypothetical protein